MARRTPLHCCCAGSGGDGRALSGREALAVYERMDQKERAQLMQEIKERELQQLWGAAGGQEEGRKGRNGTLS